MLKTIAKIAAIVATALTFAAPASAGSLASQGLADPVVVPCTKFMKHQATNNTVEIMTDANTGKCPIEFVQSDIDWMYKLPADPEGTYTYIGAWKNGKLCAVPAKWDPRRAAGNRNFQEPRVYPWRKDCSKNKLHLIRKVVSESEWKQF